MLCHFCLIYLQTNFSMSLPHDFITLMQHQLGEAEADALCRALTDTAPCTSIRTNPAKRPQALPAEAGERVPWCKEGVYLKERPVFTTDPLLHAGCYYVQEAASMFVEQAYRTICTDFTPQRVLDLCAAPGGKSTLWRSLLPDGALLVANEPIRQRAQVLAENLTKWGHPDVVCTSAYSDDFRPLSGFFDVVAADVPCSGEGMFRKDAQAVSEWSMEAVAACADRQAGIIEGIWPTLREGGYLVYSTCTFNPQEDELMVRRICDELGGELVTVPADEAWGISGDTTGHGLPVCHFMPHRTAGEGFFLALIRKTAEAPARRAKKAKKGGGAAQRQRPVQNSGKVAPWLAGAREFRIMRADEAHLVAVREALVPDVEAVTSTVHCLTAGILLAEEKGKKLIPQHALALSTALAPDAFPHAELAREDALRYLRREAITLAPDVPRGYVVATFKGHALGFLNNLGTRANNLYPQEWRIRKL